MDFILPLIVGLAIGAGVLFLVTRRSATPALPTLDPAPQADIAGQVNHVVQSALSDALAALTEQSRRDREESIKLAADRVAEASGERFGKSAQQIDTSLRNVQEDIGRRIAEMDAEIATLREQNTKKFGNVEEAVAALAKTAGDLNSVLSSSQARGQWGERMAEDMLRAAGFIEGINYEKQDTITGGGRPDYTFLMPPDRVLYMDVKFPLDSYAKYVGATELQKRDYVVSTTQHSLDYVLLFVPNESITGFVHEADPELIDWALERKVVLCSPLTLYAFLVVVRQATESFHTEETAAQIMQMMGKFKKQWEAYTKSLDKVKKNFDNLQEELDDLTVGKRFKGLGREIKKIDELRQRQNIAELPAEDDAVIDAEDYE